MQKEKKLLKILNGEDYVMLCSMVLTISGIMLSAFLTQPGLYGVTSLIVICVLIAGKFMLRSQCLTWLLLFGLVAGILELWSDWLHVKHLSTLVYTDYFGFRLLESPWYMPIGWWLTCVQFGYFTLRLHEFLPRWVVIGTVSVSGMTLPPWYEEFAAPARAWYYTTSRLTFSHTPVWIIFTYGGCMFAIAVMVLLFYQPRTWANAVVGGIFASAGFMLSGVLWFTLLG